MKLFIKIIINKLINRIVLPLKASGSKSVLNSACSLSVICFVIIIFLEGITQYVGVITTKNTITLTQFIEVPKMAEGSNTENKLVIIFMK